MARSIGIAWASIHKVSTADWNACKHTVRGSTIHKILQLRKVPRWVYSNVCNKSRSDQFKLAVEICRKAGVNVNQVAGFNDIAAFEETLNVDICVVSARLGNKFIRVPPTRELQRPRLYLYLTDNPDHSGQSRVGHYHPIINICGFFGKNYFCHNCLKAYASKTKHKCEKCCTVCKSDNCVVTDSVCVCRKCHRTCRGMECFESHKLRTFRKLPGTTEHINLSECDLWWQCTYCSAVVNTRKRDVKRHRCGEWWCRSCELFVLGDHKCFQRAMSPKDTSKFKHIYFDIECRQDDIAQCEHGYSQDVAQRCTRCLDSDEQCLSCVNCLNCKQVYCGKPVHKPNLVIAHTACDRCQNHPIDRSCDKCGSRCSKCSLWDVKEKCFSVVPCPGTCGKRRAVFKGDNANTLFGEWLFDRQHKDSTVMAHNLKGYDGVFLLQYLIGQSIRPNIIYNGSKIVYMRVGNGLNIRIIDSLSFLPMPLAALPKAFGLEELKKGYFPHLFNTRANQNYVGSFPDPVFYGYEYFKTEEREIFLQWHADQSGKLFSFQKEMLEYCDSDVSILREACLKFRKLVSDITSINGRGGVDPFNSLTIASLCMTIFKTKFVTEEYQVTLKHKLNGVICKVKGYLKDGVWDYEMDGSLIDSETLRLHWGVQHSQFRKSPIAAAHVNGCIEQFSKSSIQWLRWLEEEGGLSIRHALSPGGETNTCYEFHGCVYHGCLVCFKNDRTLVKHPHTQQSMSELYRLTKIKEARLVALGYKYISIWECQFHAKLSQNQRMKDFVAGIEVHERLDPRDSFFGGRTNAAKLYHKVVAGDEKIKYIDFTSLYPYVNKKCQYPVGHPVIITGADIDVERLDHYFGIIKLKILAPRKLLHPVLPLKTNGKLTFGLCRTCSQNATQHVCCCGVEARALLGTWCTPEIEKALTLGYRILHVYEIYHWPQTAQYSEAQSGLFSGYINTFLKVKQEASGWPDWCHSEEDKGEYLESYKEREGIQLEYSKIEKNPGLRSLAKLCLNSFWGKFGQRSNFKQDCFIHDSEAERFFQLIGDPTKTLLDFNIVCSDLLHVQWEHESKFVPQDSPAANVYIATFTTCWARLKLYDALYTLDDRVLYYDTDSVIFVSKEGFPEPPLGDYLGDFTSELKPGEFITEFVSAGPKNYGYLTSNGTEVCKVKGFTLNYQNSKAVNFRCMLREVFGVEQDVYTVNPSKICRDKRSVKLYNKKESKRYSMVYTKRVIREGYCTVPYGF